MRFALFIACLLLSLGNYRLASAQEIAFARTPGDQKIAGRLNAELGALGLNVKQVITSGDSPTTLKQIAHSAGAVAALRASPSKTGIELWVLDPRTGGTAFEEVVTLDKGRNDELLALRAVEVLRARLLRVGVAAETHEEPPPAPPPIPEIVDTRPILVTRHALLSLDVHGGFSHHLNDIGGVPVALLGLTVSPTERWSWTAMAMPPLGSTTLENDLGSAEVTTTLLGFGTDYVILPGQLGLSAGAGGTLAIVAIRGTAASSPYLGRKDRIITGLPFVRTEGFLQLAQDLSLRLGLLAGLSTPPTVIRFDGREVAPWARPLVMVTLGVRAGVPGTER